VFPCFFVFFVCFWGSVSRFKFFDCHVPSRNMFNFRQILCICVYFSTSTPTPDSFPDFLIFLDFMSTYFNPLKRNSIMHKTDIFSIECFDRFRFNIKNRSQHKLQIIRQIHNMRLKSLLETKVKIILYKIKILRLILLQFLFNIFLI